MRTSCLECVRKHLAKSAVLLQETISSTTFWLAMGNLSEAEDEAIHRFHILANHIRSTLRVPAMEAWSKDTFSKDHAEALSKACTDLCQDIDKGKYVYEPCESVPAISNRELVVARVSILLTESVMGYPYHRVLACRLLEELAAGLDGLAGKKFRQVVDKLKKGEDIAPCLQLLQWLH